MNIFRRLTEYFAFTRNEQKVFLFLSVVLLSGVAVKVYKAYIVPNHPPQFDYSVSDSIFTARSASLANDSSGRGTVPARKVNLNTASKQELMTLPGIGEAMAERIMMYREERGTIRSVAELKKIKGIGEKKFEKLKPLVEVK